MSKKRSSPEVFFKEHYARLNPQQRKAVEILDGPLLILAGPGTGKTQLLSVRAANILRERNVSAGSMLILTFTTAAARAMRERLAQIMGEEGYYVEVETFHGFANSIVLGSERAVGFVKGKIEMSSVEKVRAIEHILDNVKGVEALRPFGNPYMHRREIEARISELKNEGVLPEDFARKVRAITEHGHSVKAEHLPRLEALALIYSEYELLKSDPSGKFFDDRGRLDFDDMILVALEAIRDDRLLRESLRERYRYVMVDEYQDTNGAQLELLFAILDEERPNVCCVGDDDQAIYRFQGASLANFRLLRKKLPDLREISLRDNYRSSGKVIRTCARIIGQLPADERMGNKLLRNANSFTSSSVRFLEFATEEEELAGLTERIEDMAGSIRSDKTLDKGIRARPYNGIAVLLRTRAQILAVVDALLKAGIPYATDGEEDIRGEKRVRQMLDVLHLANVDLVRGDEKEMALYKVFSSDYMGVEYADVLKLIGYASGRLRAPACRDKGDRRKGGEGLFAVFLKDFGRFRQDRRGDAIVPSRADTARLPVVRETSFCNAHALHRACWAITRLLRDAQARPVHDMLMGYVQDTALYRFILRKHSDEEVLRIRELRSLVAFINMVKSADLSKPGLSLRAFIEELELRSAHSLPVRGRLATLSQDGVRVLTAHGAKGLEFHAVFLPFCLEAKSWPHRGRPDIVPLPADISSEAERMEERAGREQLALCDELRLFYVASSRAKAHLVYTATPQEKRVSSPFLGMAGLHPEKSSPEDEERFLVGYLERSSSGEVPLPERRVLEDMVRGISLNPTSLNTYITCPRKFLYNVLLRLPTRKNQHLVFGNSAHSALETVYSTYRSTGVFPEYDLFREAFLRTLENEGVTSSIRGWCLPRLEALRGWYEMEASGAVVPLDIEKKVELALPGGIVFRGMFDKTEPDGEKGVRVVDYKTGRPYRHLKAMAHSRDLASADCDDYYRQIVAYKLLYDRALAPRTGRTVSTGVLQFLEPASRTVKKYGIVKGEYVKEEVPVPESKVEELLGVLRCSWSDIQDLKFGRLPEQETRGRCARCEYSALCWDE